MQIHPRARHLRTMNTNAIIGADVIGLGGAIAQLGGLISLVCLSSFAILAKLSCDTVVKLKLQLLHRQKQEQELLHYKQQQQQEQ
jgi:hypothetical protein